MAENKLGTLIRAYRKELKLTQKELSKKLGVGESTVRMWELGKNYPTFPVLIRLLNILHIPADKLMEC